MTTNSNEKKPFLNAPLRWGILILLLFLFVALVFGAMQARKTSNNRVLDWFPDSFWETRKLLVYGAHFGANELLMISWDGLTPDDPIQDEVAAEMMKPAQFDDMAEPIVMFDSVATTRQMLPLLEERIQAMYDAQNITPPRPAREIAKARLDGWLLARNPDQGGIIAVASREGGKHRAKLLEKVYNDTMRVTGLSHKQIRIAGPTCDSVAIDEASAESQRTLLPIFGVLCLGLLALCLRNWIFVFTVFAISLMNQELGPALIYYLGGNMDSISLLISALVFVLSIECGIHLANYYRDALAEGEEGAVWRTIRMGWLPCFLATFTTVLGMGSLAISKVKPIQNFGIYSSMSLSIGIVLLFLYLAAFWENWSPFRYIFPGLKRKKSVDLSQVEGGENTFATKVWTRLAFVISKSYALIIFVALALLVVFSTFIANLKTSITLHGMLPESNEVIQDYNYLEERFGGLVSIETLIRIPNRWNEKRSMQEQCELIGEIERELRKIDGIDGSMSILTFLPDLPERAGGFRNLAVQANINAQLEKNMDILKETSFFYERPEDNVWRISLRVRAGLDQDYETLLENIELQAYRAIRKAGAQYIILDDMLQVAPYLKKAQMWVGDDSLVEGNLSFYNVSVDVCGAVPLVFKAQNQLLKDLIDSFIMAFGLITITLILLLRGIPAGLISMLPNILPSIIVFGTLALLEIKIDIGSMMTASVALGITVDGTLHLLTWFKRGVALGYNRKDAVIYAYAHCAQAMLQTAFICSFAFLVFSISGFVPVARFAWMLCILLFVAVAVDLLLTPALLISPLGKVFVHRPTPEPNAAQSETAEPSDRSESSETSASSFL
ncbi:MAG: MMPL family transporter [Planctomycetia bacterium]|nr:MMPL family transporter [Planctomycetia bacterium]